MNGKEYGVSGNISLAFTCRNPSYDAARMANDVDPLQSRPEVIKLFSCSTQLRMKFEMLISIKISRNLAYFRLSKPRMLYFLLLKCQQ